MRQARLKVPSYAPAGHYHCMSRVVDKRFVFQDLEKRHFVRLMRECEAFCQITVLTYIVMSNHFHLLLEVPKTPALALRPGMDEVLVMLSKLSGHQNVGAVRQQVALFRENKDADAEKALLARFHARMWDVSAFMKLFKQRLTQWYNKRTDRKGTLWEERFKSVVVDGMGQGLAAMAAYIDLNAVRAGLVKDPKDYSWCGYGAAMAGDKRARQGLSRVVAGWLGREESMQQVLARYRMQLFNRGAEERESMDREGRKARGYLSSEAVKDVLAKKGKLGMSDYLRCRVRYFCDGAVLGSRGFVEGMFRAHRKRFGIRRRSGARRMRGLEEELYSLRDLRVALFG